MSSEYTVSRRPSIDTFTSGARCQIAYSPQRGRAGCIERNGLRNYVSRVPAYPAAIHRCLHTGREMPDCVLSPGEKGQHSPVPPFQLREKNRLGLGRGPIVDGNTCEMV